MITCPICSQPHQEYWWVMPSGKRVLSYTCKRVPHQKIAPDGRKDKLVMQTKRLEVGDLLVTVNGNSPPCEERWSRGWAKKQQDAAQMSFPETPPCSKPQVAELAQVDAKIGEAMSSKRLLDEEYQAICQRIRAVEYELKQLGKRRSELTTLQLI